MKFTLNITFALFTLFNFSYGCFDKSPINFYFDEYNLLINNIDNYNPNKSAEILFSRAGVGPNNRLFDLVMTSDDYFSKSEYNEVVGVSIFKLNIFRDFYTEMPFKLTLSFYDHYTGEPLVLDYFYLTFLDIDYHGSSDVKKHEEICLREDEFLLDESFIPGYNIYENSSYVDMFIDINKSCYNEDINGNSIRFRSMKNGKSCDNPISPFDDMNFYDGYCYDDLQSKRSIQLAFYKKSSVDIKLSMPCIRNDNEFSCKSNRFIYFTGISSLSDICNYQFDFHCMNLDSCNNGLFGYKKCGCCQMPVNRQKCIDYKNNDLSTSYTTTKTTTDENIYTIYSTSSLDTTSSDLDTTSSDLDSSSFFDTTSSTDDTTSSTDDTTSSTDDTTSSVDTTIEGYVSSSNNVTKKILRDIFIIYTCVYLILSVKKW